MDADLVALGDDAALLVGVEERGDGGDVEGRLDAVTPEDLQDARYADAVAELAPGEAADRLGAVAHLVRLMVAVEGERDGAARPVLPRFGAKRAAGANVVHDAPP